MNKKNIIYYWASNEKNNNGEGILAKKFLYLLKKNLRHCRLVPLNKYRNIDNKTVFYKYILPFWGALVLWKYSILGKKVSYVNFLPAWNFILIFFLPPKTILGPVTGSINRLRYSKVIKLFSFFGLGILKIRFKKILFSHDFFKKKYDKKKNKIFYNFLLYNFQIKKEFKKKKFDIIFYIKNHENKKNEFAIELINELSNLYKICVIGDKININNNIFNKGFVSRKKATQLIKLSKAAVASYENLFSFFLLDSLQHRLTVFYNKDYNPRKSIKSKLLVPIDYNNSKKSINIIKKKFN